MSAPNTVAVIDRMVTATETRFAPVLAGRDLTIDTFSLGLRAALTREPKLAIAAANNPQSLFVALAQAAHLGLSPDQQLGHFYLIPYGKEIQAQVGYRGLVFLAQQSDQVAEVNAMVIYRAEAERLIDKGLEVVDSQTGKLNVSETARMLADYDMTDESIVGAVAWVRLKSGGLLTRTMTRAEIDRRRRAGSANSPAWTQWFAEMAKKTALRSLLRRGDVPMGAHHRRIMRALEAEEEGAPLPTDEPAAVQPIKAKPQPKKSIEVLDHDRRDADPLPSDDDRRAELTSDIWEMADRAGIDTEAVHAWSTERHGADIETATLDALADVRRALEAGDVASEPAAVAKVRGMFGEEEHQS